MPTPSPAPARPPPRRLAAWALTAGALSLAGCGSTPAAPPSAPRPPGVAPPGARLRALPAPAPAPTGTRPCPSLVAGTLGAVAERIYSESSTGPNALQAVARVERTSGLVHAVAHGKRAAVRAIVAHLAAPAAAAHIVRLQVAREVAGGSRLLADAGSGPAMAPVGATLRDAQGRSVGTFLLSVQSVRAYAGITRAVTGARVLVRARAGRAAPHALAGSGGGGPARIPRRGPVRFRGRTYQAYSFPARALPARALPAAPVRVSLLIAPSALASCAPTAARTEAGVLAAVDRRIYEGESRGPDVSRALRAVTAAAPLRRAVAGHDAGAARAAMLVLLASHLHIVRLRVSWPGQSPIDVGGPTVLAPVTGTLPAGPGRAAADVELSIQDDHGYVLLARRFTGADVLVRQGARQVMGTLTPGPARLPDLGLVTYRGARYLTYSFPARAFPSGTLRLSLLFALS